ncbi:tata-binding protein-associated factor 172-like protein [Dermatophagoides farinae]|uniref:Tata-binding protein-associated factor 172-like protein n=1 Tax=Dermatophagoides farinae TaxID=6954 RepID=A0A9D4SJV5_DERFA|nr:tata-binding protein-associated factor 172-like protein [Dermatophagoides farinae]
MASRLDRLFLLLDNGSTPLTRKAAALQLGEVQKLHPHELNTLLVKVRQYLHSSSWETRIAASQAVEAIISNVPNWFPIGSLLSTNDDNDEQNDANDDECRMRFDRYDIMTVIKCGHNLLASEGKDFDAPTADSSSSSNTVVVAADATLDSREKIAQMRQSLNQKLGLSFAEKIGLKMDFISNADLIATADVESKPIVEKNLKLEQIIPNVKTSSSIVKRKTSPDIKIENSNDPSMAKKIKLESVDDENSNEQQQRQQQQQIDNNNIFDGDEWPLAWFSDELMSDLFNAQWEIRHGAAIGLREIVKLQGRCGGRIRTASLSRQDALNQQWLEDLSLRLLSVLALDRFGDFLSDQVVAPVRETCAQVLGLIIKLLSTNGVHNVLAILLQLLQCNEWEARHGGMLGLKYLLAIRQDMIEQLLPKVFEPIFAGLKDPEDDVSAVAAAALVPIKDQLMCLMPEKVPLVIAFLWEALLVLDDLSSSTGDLLMLLSSLLTFKGLTTTDFKTDNNDQQLAILIPRLWPFLSHSLSSVRRSVLESLLILSEKNSNEWLNQSSLLSDALRLLYQRSLIENHTIILDLLYKVWLNLISKANYQCLIESTRNYVTSWICLMMQPQKMPIDVCNTPVWLEIKHITHSLPSSSASHLKNSRPSTSQQQQQLLSSLPAENYFIGGSESLGETSEERERCAIRARYQCARLIGALAFYLTEENGTPSLNGAEQSNVESSTIIQNPLDSFASLLLIHLNTKSAIQRMCSAWIIREWATAKVNRQGEQQPPWIITMKNDDNDVEEYGVDQKRNSLQLHKGLADRCNESLEEQIFFDEISAYVSRVQYNFRDLLATTRTNKVQFNDTELAGKTVYTFPQINSVIDNIQHRSLMEMRQKLIEIRKPNDKLKSLIECLEEKISLTRLTITELNQLTNSLSIGVKSSLASALIEWRFLPDRLSPIIKPVMDSIKQEDNEQLQRGSASSLVKLLNIFRERTYLNSVQSTPTAKIINNLITYLCSDRNFTPEVRLSIDNDNSDDKTKRSDAQYGILALDNMQKIAELNIALRRSNSMNMKNRNNQNQPLDDSNNGNNNGTSTIMNEQQQEKQGEIQRRGATIALSETCRAFGQYLPEQLPSLWEYIAKISLESQSPPAFDENGLKSCRDLIQSLQVFEIIGPYLHQQLHSSLKATFNFLGECLQNPYITVRHMAARCFGMLSSINLNVTMDYVLTKVLDMLEASDSELKRQGSVETIYFIIYRLSLKIVPYIVLLIVPMLGRMSDQNESVRLLATHCFAQLVQLMPLDNDHHNHHQKK